MGEKNKQIKNRSHLMNYVVILASIIVILAGIHAAKVVLAPVFMAIFLSVLLLPSLNWLRSKGISQFTSLVVVILTVLVIGTTTTTVITTQLREFALDLPRYRDRFNERLLNYNLDLSDIFPFLWESAPVDSESPAVEPPATAPPATAQPATAQPQSRLRRSTVPKPVQETAFLDVPERSAGSVAERLAIEGAARSTVPKSAASGGSPIPADVRAEALPEPTEPVPIRTFFGDEEIHLEEDRRDQDQPASADGAAGESADGSNVAPPAVPYSEPWAKASETAVRASSKELFNFIGNFIGEMTVFASSAFIIMLLVIFMLLEASRLPLKILAALGNRDFTNERLDGVVFDIRRYMVIKTFVSILVGLFVTALLLTTHVKYPILWGVIAFFLNYIPNIGSVIAAIPPILLATVDQSLVSGAVVAFFMMVINCGIGYFLEPKLLGDGLDLSPLVVLLSLIFCGWLLGPVGMFLSPPLAVIAKIILLSFPETRWIAVLMANSVPRDGDGIEECSPPKNEQKWGKIWKRNTER